MTRQTATQLPLELAHEPSFDPADFIETESNGDAARYLANWGGEADSQSTSHALVLTGPVACGKSHLAHIWAKRVGAAVVTPGDSLIRFDATFRFLVEDADRLAYDPVQLFHFFNWARENAGAILFTARTPPQQWNIPLPDLASRVRSVPVLSVQAPDDALLNCLMVKLFADRQLSVDPAVIRYAGPRMERSFEAAHRLAACADRLSLSEKRKVSMAIMRRALDEASGRLPSTVEGEHTARTPDAADPADGE